MSPAPVPADGTSVYQPFTYTNDVGDLGSLSSLFITKTQMPPPASSLSPEQQSAMDSVKSAISQSAKTASDGGQTVASTTLSTARTPLQSSAAAASSNSAAQSSITQAVGSSNAAGATITSQATTSGSAVPTSAANTSANNVQTTQSKMSSPGMQAAVAVPVVLIVLVAAVLIFFCIRRRRRTNDPPHEEAEKAPIVGAKKTNWTRHLRVFSFDNELLGGGRYSSTNSIRSRQTGSLRSGTRNNNGTDSPSVHSVEEVAPPYRDAIRSTQAPNIGTIMAGTAAGAGATTAALNRSVSGATAPPSYKSPLSRTITPGSATSSIRDPFADTQSPVSPVDGSPFNDPDGAITPAISRNTSIYQSDRDDVSSIGDAASIRQAQIARNASVMSGGRVIDNTRRTS